MRKVLAAVLFGIFTLTMVVVALHLYPYNPVRPPPASESGYKPEGLNEVVLSSNRFALKLYSALANRESGNIFLSPFSIYSALALVYEGARGSTAAEFRDSLGYPDPTTLRQSYAYIYNSLNKLESVELRTGNALWVQVGFDLLPEYLKLVTDFYAAKAANLDFIGDSEGSRRVINSFIEEQTRGRIKDLLPPGSLDPFVRLVLTNAIYFKGVWLYQFNRSETSEGIFWVSRQQSVKVPMMCMAPEDREFMYAETEELQVLELPYTGSRISMVIILPKGDVETIESALSLEKLETLLSEMKPEKLERICIPRFELRTRYNLNSALYSLGLKEAFTEEADLSGIDGKRDLYVGLVVHQAYAKVDEEGTEAAGATAVVIRVTAVMERKAFVADHPFIFLIRDRETGLILFMGRVMNPSSG